MKAFKVDAAGNILSELGWCMLCNIQDVFNKLFSYCLQRSKNLPKLIVMGSATHAIKTSNGSATALEEYKRNLTSLSTVSYDRYL